MIRRQRRHPFPTPTGRASRRLGSFVCAGSVAVSFLAACGGSDAGKDEPLPGYELPKDAQTPGDAAKGRDTLLNGSYMSCGVPWKLWADPNLGAAVKQNFGAVGDGTIEGRTGKNADLPYSLNAFTTTDGAEVVNANCLTCHGGHFDGELVIGMGNPAADFTTAPGAGTAGVPDSVFASLGLTEPELANLNKVLRFGRDVGPSMKMRTIGLNPAEQLTGELIAHHDKDSLHWSSTPLIDVAVPKDAQGNPIEDARLTSDPPPWWRAHKKNALFYNAMARGDHRGTMALATAVCVDTVDEATRVDKLFKDINAFIATVRPPAYGRPIDRALAKTGQTVFESTCSECHGTYADDPTDDAHDTFPNLLIPLETIGTDPAVANAPLDNQAGVDWYNGSFYGSITRAVPDDPYPGYIAPPLDGIWATAPYLHNASVPNMELVLNSKARPKYWKRVDFDTTNFDEERLGWPYEEVDHSQADEQDPVEQKKIYDTTYYSQTNGGHTFGDALSNEERRAVIEYLKTL